MKIEPGEYKTKGGLRARIVESNKNGAIGWIIGANGERFPKFWHEDGQVDTHAGYDLDLSRTIKIPATELPEPERVFNTNFYEFNTLHADGKMETTAVRLHVAIDFESKAAAEQWAAFLRQVMEGGEL